jgi:NADH-quinone oxidoreductase subunit N
VHLRALSLLEFQFLACPSLLSLSTHYLRWIAPVYGRGEPPARNLRGSFVPASWSATTAVVTAGLSLALGIGAGALWSVFSV